VILSPNTLLEERFLIQKRFNSGMIDVIVTCDAFDEGFEDLTPKAIYLLSSPTSPRIIFKRRGQLLMPLEGKEMPKIYDFITIPPRQGFHDPLQKEIIMRELPRILELKNLASDADLEEYTEYLESMKQENLLVDQQALDFNRKIFIKEETYYD
jgi:superfamily II DNA or RNA helicase